MKSMDDVGMSTSDTSHVSVTQHAFAVHETACENIQSGSNGILDVIQYSIKTSHDEIVS